MTRVAVEVMVVMVVEMVVTRVVVEVMVMMVVEMAMSRRWQRRS